MLNLNFQNGQAPALNARNMNAIVESINTLGYAVGGPNVASTVSEMTDTSKVYVYTGSETGYTAGNWYYYNGSAWVSGGVYQATAVETDTTLTMSGVAADAKVTGDSLNKLEHDFIGVKSSAPHLKTNGEESYYDYNDFIENGLYLLDTPTRKDNSPNGSDNFNALKVENYSSTLGYIKQTTFNITVASYDAIERSIYIRYKNQAGWTTWVQTNENVLATKNSGDYLKNDGQASYYDYNDFIKNGLYLLGTSIRKNNSPNGSNNFNALKVENYSSTLGYIKQTTFNITAASYDAVERSIYIRYKTQFGWTKWVQTNVDVLATKNSGEYLKNDGQANYYDLNDFVKNGLYLLDTPTRKDNQPNVNSSFNCLIVEIFSNSLKYLKQTLFNITLNGVNNITSTIYVRYRNQFGWSAWTQNSGGSGTINNNTFNQYTTNNTYNVSATPEISSVSDYFLPPSGDTRDRTNDIVTLLSTTGVCRLGAGNYYITSGISMPNNTTIIGCGRATRLILNDSVENGFVISVGNYCTVQDLTLYGGFSAYRPTIDSVVSGRNAIQIIGDYTGFSDQGTYAHNFCQLSNLYIFNFTGSAIFCYRNDGGGGFNANNVDIYGCGVGINIDTFSEYHAFSNVRTRWCRYGCINNGGNNLFNNCHFDTCIQALLMDNTYNDKINNSHSSFNNCTFNHPNNNQGTGIEVINMSTGVIFTSCQIFYAKVISTNSGGIVISNCNFGTGIKIIITNSTSILINNNVFGDMPTITESGNTSLVFDNNYIRSNGATVEIP